MTLEPKTCLAGAAGTALCLFAMATLAAAGGASVAPAEASPPSGALELQIPDVPVLTQDGKEVSFYRDLVAGKVVAIQFIFTTCTTICPPLGVKFGAVQDLLGKRFGKDAFLISVSVDPVHDTPARLKAWGAKFKARPGWTLVTGRKQDVDALLRALSSSDASPGDHSPMVLVGNDATHRWTRAHGLAPASALAKTIEQALSPAATVAKALP